MYIKNERGGNVDEKLCKICGTKNKVNTILCRVCNSFLSYDETINMNEVICPSCNFVHSEAVDVCINCEFPIALNKKAMSDVNRIYNEVFSDELVECVFCNKMTNKHFDTCGFCNSKLLNYPLVELKYKNNIITIMLTERFEIFGNYCVDLIEAIHIDDVHCIFHKGTKNIFIQDLSYSGILLNNELINKYGLYCLEEKDVISMGGIDFKVNKIRMEY